MSKNKKYKLKEKIKCPWCKKRIVVKVQEIVTVKATPAVKNRKVIVEKDTQKTLK